MINYILILLKNIIRNRTKEKPIGYTFLGRIGDLLLLPYIEVSIFFLLLLFINVMIVGSCQEMGDLSSQFGINPTYIILGVFVEFLLINNYYQGYMTRINLYFLKVVPLSAMRKFIYAFLSEVISIKALIIPSFIVAYMVFAFSNLMHILNLIALSSPLYIGICSISMILSISINKLLVKIMNGFTMLFCAIILLKYHTLDSVEKASNNSLFLLTTLGVTIGLILISFAIFKRIYISRNHF